MQLEQSLNKQKGQRDGQWKRKILEDQSGRPNA